MNCIYDFFATLGSGWTNGATVVGAVLGIGLSIFAIWFSKTLSDEGSTISAAIRDNTSANQKQTEAVHKHTKVLRLDNLRNLYELSKGQDTRDYWHFRWRFETNDRLGVQVQRKNGDERIMLGHCDILIEGFSGESQSHAAACHGELELGFKFKKAA